MKKTILFISIVLFSFGVSAQWKPAGDKLKTVWTERFDPNRVLPEYLRPLGKRPERDQNQRSRSTHSQSSGHPYVIE